MQGEISSIQTPGIDHRQLLAALPDAVMLIGTDFTGMDNQTGGDHDVERDIFEND